jgi:M6 family metalloprotease-like protein
MTRLLLAVFVVLCMIGQAHAGPANPQTFEIVQPDGSAFPAVARGDEHGNWIETKEGYPVIETSAGWFYAEVENGQLVPTPYAVGAVDARAGLGGLDKNVGNQLARSSSEEVVYMDEAQSGTIATRASASAPAAPMRAAAETSTTQPVLVILASYGDAAISTESTELPDRVFGSTNSVKDYFLENSYGQFIISPAAETQGTANDGVVMVTITGSHPNPGEDIATTRDMIWDAVNAADDFVNFGSFDTDSNGIVTADEMGLLVIFGGYEKSYAPANSQIPNIWSHAGTTQDDFFGTLFVDKVTLPTYATAGARHATVAEGVGHESTIGVLCHELAHHLFHLPDLADSSGSSVGIGDWGLLGTGAWNTAGGFAGSSPSHLSAWSKVVSDFLTPYEMLSERDLEMPEVERFAKVMRLWMDPYRGGQSFLLENRQQTGYDAGLPGSGLLVWHTDGMVLNNDNPARKLVDLEEADGLADLDTAVNQGDAGDPFPGSALARLFDEKTQPNSNTNEGEESQIEISNISDSKTIMQMHVDPRTPDYLGSLDYVENRIGGVQVFGFNNCKSLLEVTNNTTHDTIEGFDVFTTLEMVIDFQLQETVASTQSLHTQAGFMSQVGWNRFFLDTPQDIPPGESRVMVLSFGTTTGTCPIAFERTRTPSGNSYTTTTAQPSQISGELRQRVLVSGGTQPPEEFYQLPDNGLMMMITGALNSVPSYTISATAGAGGTIDPAGSVLVREGSDQTFTITPDTGFVITDVLVDSVSQGAIDTYAFTGVTEPHTIEANFTNLTYTVTPSVSGGNGTISPDTAQTVNHGDNITFTFTPDAGFVVSQVLVGGVEVNPTPVSEYTINNVTADTSITVSYDAQPTLVSMTALGNDIVIEFSEQVTVSNGWVSAMTFDPGGTNQDVLGDFFEPTGTGITFVLDNLGSVTGGDVQVDLDSTLIVDADTPGAQLTGTSTGTVTIP